MESSKEDTFLWQLRRLQILKRDNFTCCNCKTDLAQLHIHHKQYDSRLKYWQYPDNYFVTLCPSCHDKEHKGKSTSDFYIKEGRIKAYKFDTALLKAFGLTQPKKAKKEVGVSKVKIYAGGKEL